MSKPKIETEIRMAEDLVPLMLDGSKRVTIRKGHRHFATNVVIEGYVGVVEQVEWFTTETCPLKYLTDDGFVSFKEVVDGMKRYYPDFAADTPITVVRFRIRRSKGKPLKALKFLTA